MLRRSDDPGAPAPGGETTVGGPRAPPARQRGARGAAPWIAVLYAVLGFAWIAFSDRAVLALFPDPGVQQTVQSAKGVAYVGLTAVLLFLLIRRSEGGLRAVGAELSSTIESMPDAVLLIDGRGQVAGANRAAAELFGHPDRAALLVGLDELARRHELRRQDGSPVPLDEALPRDARRRSFAATLRRADGQEVHVDVSASPVAGGPAPLVVAVLRDVSAARRLERARDEFLATAAHEFKTPLAVIKAYAQLMQKRVPEAQALGVIQRQVDRLTRLVQHLLDTSRLALDGRVSRETFDLARVTGEVLERMKPSAPAHHLALVAPPRASVVADRERIERVITSLVDNAVRFSPRGGDVTIRVERDGTHVVLSVSDQGVGIPHERQSRIFERYYRAHEGTPDDYGGLGLGLDVSREIVTRHEGRMWFESVPGKGSTFFFTLPAAEERT